MISSDSTSLSYVLYSINSILSLSEYYVGIWIVVPFVIYSLVHFGILMKREKEFDLFVASLMTLLFLDLAFLFFPRTLGQGLENFALKYVDTYFAFFSSILFAFLVGVISLRGSFWTSMKGIKHQLESIGLAIFKVISVIYKRSHNSMARVKASTAKIEFKGKVENFLKDGDKNSNTKKIESQASKISLKEKLSNLAPKVSRPKEEEQFAKKEVKVEDTINNTDSKIDYEWEGQDKVSFIEDPTRIDKTEVQSVTVANKENKFFESEDLIDCISDNTTHKRAQSPDEIYFETIGSTIESKLNEFNVKGDIINILKGPVVDTFELDLGEGIKASKVKGLEDDIGLALNGAPVRVVYPLKGRSTIGIEVPRNPREFIYLDEVLQTDAFNQSNLRLPIAMGKDAFGETSVVDLAGMPHMLVAGATGAGKSVFINTLLVSLIIKKSPQELRLILIDPKQLELALFASLPHLLLPVITEASKAAISLLWAVEEMDRRYTILKDMGVKNIEGFNKKLKSASPAQLSKIHGHYENADEEGYELPYIVIVIDEFADLILTKSGKEIETNVNRLAAKARAAGIHLVLATQRPSTDVITGVIKANFPTRVAFRVTTGHDSKTILDLHGAQKLLGKGDMLYKHGVDLLRLHSAFVDEREIETLVDKLSEIQVDYSEGAMEFLENGGEIEEEATVSSGSYVSGTSDDPVYQEALQVVMESGSASASMLQRRLRVGYNRAANLIDELERNGVVGPAQGSKPRKVLVSGE
jgi:S-DNA-T family DNA segregation ATPase FtsK/SpoIIIE